VGHSRRHHKIPLTLRIDRSKVIAISNVETPLADDDDDKEKKPVQQIGAFITIPFVLAVPPILGWLIGSWLDKTFDLAPIFMYSFIVLGFIAGFREAIRIVKTYGDDI